MSDAEERSDSGSGSGSDGEGVETTGLIATRAKRSTAGNLYASLRANLDDEDVRRDLLAEDEEDDAEDYEGSEKEDDDEAMESSSDEEDAGPPKEGEAEDLAGEKALQKTERAEARKKRKVQDARLKLPAWQKKNKRVKLADDVKSEDGAAAAKPKKKSERANWLPSAADAPLRQSGRSLAVQNREVTHANLKQSYERSEKQRKVMKNAAERDKDKQKRTMSQLERLEICKKIAKQTDRDFGRWEREEAERQRIRDEQLAAKRKRDLDGPVVRYWSGSAIWRGDKLEEKRVPHGSLKVEELKAEPKKPAIVEGDSAPQAASSISTISETGTTAPAAASTNGQPLAAPPSAPASNTNTQAQVPWLQGIHDYATQQAAPAPSTSALLAPQPGAPSTVGMPPYVQAPPAAAAAAPTPAPTTVAYQSPSSNPYTGWPPGAQQFPVQLPSAPPPPPVITEQAQRSLLMLEHFDSLETASKRSKSATTPLEPSAPATVLLPESYPSFNPDESKYLLAKHSTRKKIGAENIPPGPDKTKCAIIPNAVARYRDPKTGLPYLDRQCYKIIQRVLAGGCQWSGLLGAWVGPSYGVMGRPARGVPEDFNVAPAAVGKGVVKMESAGDKD